MTDAEFETIEITFADGLSETVTGTTKTTTKNLNYQADYRMHKKLGQGVKVLCTQEKKKLNDLVTNVPKTDLIVLYFGSGDESDQIGLEKFLQPYGEKEVHVFPAVSYGFVQFKTVEMAENFLKDAVKLEDSNIVANSFEIKFGDKLRNVFFFYSKVGIDSFARYNNVDFPNASRSLTISGLTLLENFITEEYETAIVKFLDKVKWNPMNNRRVVHYGYEFLYGTNNVDKMKPIEPFPEIFKELMDKLNEQIATKHGQQPFDQCTINDYVPGQGIPPHVDSHSPFEEMFVSISLISGVVMSFRNQKLEQKHLFFPRRGVVVFTGEGRYAWYHSIAQRKLDKVEGKLVFRKRRISLTFRKIQKQPCKCAFPYFCDSQGYDPNEMKKIFKEIEDKEKAGNTKKGESAQEGEPEECKMEQEKTQADLKPGDIEKKYVYDTYDKIAPHFSYTRVRPWPKVSEFLQSLEKGSIVADIGCGNGKYLGINNENIYMLGSDRSENLIDICKNRDISFQVFSAESLRLPLRPNSMDAVISIAVIHHFSTKELRIQAVRELARVTTIGGRILVYVWAFEQDTGKKYEHQDVLIPWHLQLKYEDAEKVSNILNESGVNTQVLEEKKEPDLVSEKSFATSKKAVDYDAFVSEEKKSVVYKRYYHLFKQGELEDIIKNVENVEIEKAYYDHANWCAVLIKK